LPFGFRLSVRGLALERQPVVPSPFAADTFGMKKKSNPNRGDETPGAEAKRLDDVRARRDVEESAIGKPKKIPKLGAGGDDAPTREGFEIARAFMDDDGVISVDVMPGMPADKSKELAREVIEAITSTFGKDVLAEFRRMNARDAAMIKH
jgi:hypothetical protein